MENNNIDEIKAALLASIAAEAARRQETGKHQHSWGHPYRTPGFGILLPGGGWLSSRDQLVEAISSAEEIIVYGDPEGQLAPMYLVRLASKYRCVPINLRRWDSALSAYKAQGKVVDQERTPGEPGSSTLTCVEANNADFVSGPALMTVKFTPNGAYNCWIPGEDRMLIPPDELVEIKLNRNAFHAPRTVERVEREFFPQPYPAKRVRYVQR